MAVSKHRGVIGQKQHGRMTPPRTPGPLGVNDAADPSALACFGDTPGPLGAHDFADPTVLACYANEGFGLRHPEIVVSPICAPGIVAKPSAAAYVIPQPRSTTPPLISDSDIANAAATLGVEPAAVYAVSKVESGGRTGFDEKGRPKILFEARWFHKFTSGKYDKSHPHLSQLTWAGAKKYYGNDQWTRLNEAFALDPEAALKSASWGKFQVMGFNHNGFDDVRKFCDAMFVSESEHLGTFLAFCKDNNLVRYLKSKEWAKFAQGYNGDEYKANKYDEKLKQAYDEYKKRSGNAKK